MSAPLSPQPEDRPADATAREPEQPRVQILLVDDRPENLLALEAILEPLGQELVRALSGAEALRKVLTHDFAVILLDVQMPGLNGFETAQIIKSRERSRHTPIIFLTAISKEEEYVFEGYQVGAVDYLFKPFQPHILRSKVSVFVDLYLKRQQLRRQEQLLRESERREMELRHMREMWESEQRFSAIVATAMDAIVSFDDDGRITLFNSAAEMMFGRRARDVVGHEVGECFPAAERDAVVRRLKGIAPRPAPRADDVSMRALPRVEAFTGARADGAAFPIEASVACLELNGRRLYTMIARDVSEQRRNEEALRQQAESLTRYAAELRALNEELKQRQEDLQRAMSARSRFYASMSHELRTPINAILGYNTLLLENIYGPLNERQTEGIQRAHKAARHLLELVNDVLDLSKIEAGKIELKLQPTTFPELIDDLFVTVRPMADERGCEISLRHEGEPRKLVTDPRRVRQILLNLLSNAIKFGGGKPIEVRSVALPDDGIEVAVIDHGAGIAPEDQTRIFDEFVQLGRATSQEGTGLGLPISRRLAQLLRGSLTVESEVGKGSTFRLRLPNRGDDGHRDAAAAAASATAGRAASPVPAPPPESTAAAEAHG